MNPARILIVDPHPVTREGLRQFLAADPARWDVCGSESNALQAIAQTVRLEPDLAIVEYDGHGMDCLELAAELRKVRRSLKVMAYTLVTLPYPLLRMFHASGLAGYVLKTEPIPELALGLQIIQEQRLFRSREATQLYHRQRKGSGEYSSLPPGELGDKPGSARESWRVAMIASRSYLPPVDWMDGSALSSAGPVCCAPVLFSSSLVIVRLAGLAAVGCAACRLAQPTDEKMTRAIVAITKTLLFISELRTVSRPAQIDLRPPISEL
jgi:DNA-binding NarL/FixJ family response regulator